jgi:hypothetical protein
MQIRPSPVHPVGGDAALHVQEVIGLVVVPVEELGGRPVHPLVALVHPEAGKADPDHVLVVHRNLCHDEVVLRDVMNGGQMCALAVDTLLEG